MAQNTGNARNILVGASPLFLSVEDSTTSGYVENMVPGTAITGATGRNKTVPAFKNGTSATPGPYVAGESYTTTLNAVDATAGSAVAPATPVHAWFSKPGCGRRWGQSRCTGVVSGPARPAPSICFELQTPGGCARRSGQCLWGHSPR